MKTVHGAAWPYNPADPGTWPMRNHGGPAAYEPTGGMPPEATLTPSADEPPVIEEVASDDLPGEGDDQGSVEPA